MYKKIAEGVFEIPEYISSSAAEVIKACLIIDPKARVKVSELKKMSWIISHNSGDARFYRGFFVGVDTAKTDEKIVKKMREIGFDSDDLSKIIESQIFSEEYLV